jgi:hypothetical protein
MPIQPDISEIFPMSLAAYADEEASMVLELLCGQLSPNTGRPKVQLARVLWSSLTPGKPWTRAEGWCAGSDESIRISERLPQTLARMNG